MFLKLPFEARHGLPVAFVGICQSVGEPRSLGFACRRHAFNIHARSALGIDRGGEGRNVLLSFPTLGRQEIGTCSNDEFPVDGIGVDVGEFRLFGARGTEESQRIALAQGECVGLPHRCSASGDIEEGRIECRCGVAPMRTAESYLFVKIRKRTLLSATCPPASLGHTERREMLWRSVSGRAVVAIAASRCSFLRDRKCYGGVKRTSGDRRLIHEFLDEIFR